MDCSPLQKIEELFERETALLEDVGESAFGQLRVHGNDCLTGFVVGTFFERNMAAFWRNSTKPALFSARTTRSPETLGSFGMSVGDFDRCPELRGFGGPRLGHAPGFEVELDRFAKVGPGTFDVLALGSDTQFRAAFLLC